jgi:pimeloyl-ACP methyl ester carboxylesterase
MEFLIGYVRSIPGADIDRLAVMGFSWGGLASVLTTMRTPSVKALVSLDGSIAYFYHRQFEHNPDMNIARFTVPSLFLKQHTPSAEMKKSLGPDSVFDFFKDIKYSDATLVTFNTLAHQNFGEWFDRLQYAPGPAFVADTLVQSVGYEHVALYVRHFLDATLKHDAEGQAFLGRSPADNGISATELTVEHHTALSPPAKRFEQ